MCSVLRHVVLKGLTLALSLSLLRLPAAYAWLSMRVTRSDRWAERIAREKYRLVASSTLFTLTVHITCSSMRALAASGLSLALKVEASRALAHRRSLGRVQSDLLGSERSAGSVGQGQPQQQWHRWHRWSWHCSSLCSIDAASGRRSSGQRPEATAAVKREREVQSGPCPVSSLLLYPLFSVLCVCAPSPRCD